VAPKEQSAYTAGPALLWNNYKWLNYTGKNPVHKASYYIYSSNTWHTIHTNLKRPSETASSRIRY